MFKRDAELRVETMSNSSGKRKVFIRIAFILIILMCTVSVYCAGSSLENFKINSENETENKVEMTITDIVRSELDYAANVRKTDAPDAGRLCNRGNRFLFADIRIILSAMMSGICIFLFIFKNETVKSGIRLVCHIQNKDGKKEQRAILQY